MTAGRWFAAGLFLAVGGAGAAGFAAPVPLPAERSPSASGRFFKDGPPARVTGGFGEPSCLDCHWNGSENEGPGALQVTGLPERAEPGTTYPLTVTLVHPGMAVGGFQLALRNAGDTTGAGSLAAPPDEKGRVGVLTERDVDFAHHLLAGIELSRPDTASWTVLWTAPRTGARGPILLHASAVAGDGDDSQIGDRVYTTEGRTSLATQP